MCVSFALYGRATPIFQEQYLNIGNFFSSALAGFTERSGAAA
jgi:hypothetical protein